MKNRKLWITFLLLICMLAVAACGKKDKEEEEGEATEEVVSDNTTTTNGSGPMIETDMSLNQTTDPSILSLANTYCDCLVNGDVDTYTRIMDQVSEEDKIRLQKKSESDYPFSIFFLRRLCLEVFTSLSSGRASISAMTSINLFELDAMSLPLSQF